MTQTQRKEIKSRIIEELASLKREIPRLEELCRPISPECALGDLARFELMNDQEISEKTLHKALIRAKKLEYALRKVDDPDYSLCTECEEAISIERLLILPESTFCIACASNRAS